MHAGLVAVAAIAALFVPAKASPAPAGDRTAVVDVSRSVVFTATETSSVRLRFAKHLRWKDVAHVHIKGQGRLFGFILRRVGDFEQEAYRPVREWMATAACDTRACRTPRDEHPGAIGFHFGRNLNQLGGGLWDAYVVADGAPVRVELLFKGSKRRDEVRVGGPVVSELRTLPATVDVEPGHNLYAVGDFTHLDDTDYGHVSIWAMGEPYAASMARRCAYYTEEDAPDTDAFAPHCPDSAEMAQVPVANATAGTRRQPVYSFGFADGERGIGAWLSMAGVVTEVAAVALWIDFPEV